MMLWEWEADADRGELAGERWLMFHPNKWNRTIHYGWRYDPRELQAAHQHQNAVDDEGDDS